MYENGFGVKQDEAEARRLYRLGGRQESDAADVMQAGFFLDARLGRPDAASRAVYQEAAVRGEPRNGVGNGVGKAWRRLQRIVR